MIKIAFVIDTIDSPTAGTERQLLMLLKHLDRRQFDPYLCVLRSSAWLEQEFDLCPLHVAGIRSFKQLGSWRRLWRFARFLKREGIAIVQTHFRDSDIAGIIAARLAGTAAIIATRRNQGYWHKRGEVALKKLLSRRATVIIANSQSTKQWTAAVEGVPAERIRVIHNGIELEAYPGSDPVLRERCRRQLGLSGNTCCIGVVANLRPVKGIDVFLRAAAQVARRVDDVRFLIAGEGEERAALMRLAAELGLGGAVRFLGRRRDVPSLLAAFDIGVLSSHSESFSNALIEYMAAGLPVVTTDVGGSREAVEDGVSGFVVPVGDDHRMAEAIIRIAEDRTEGLRMGQRGRRCAEQLFSSQSCIEKSEALYRACGLSRVRDARQVCRGGAQV
ncbi:MAG: glycosyltransferase [Nitrospirota bacterium]